VRLTKLSTASPEMQLVYQLGVSAIIMAPWRLCSRRDYPRVHICNGDDVRLPGDLVVRRSGS
jgi:hypothetical protein